MNKSHTSRLALPAWLILLLCLSAWVNPARAEIPPVRKISIVLIGDSTVDDRTGWGAAFKALVNDHATVINMARGGRSSKSYRDEGHWAKAIEVKGDYYLIQFGHNDMPGKGPKRETDPATTFSDNLARYVDEVRAIDGKPILVTPLTRRIFDDKHPGRVISGLVDYANAVKKVAASKNVPLVDLHDASVTLVEKLGPTESAKLDLVKADGTRDTTHLDAKSASVFAPLVVEGLRRAAPELSSVFKPAAVPNF